jgi:hypothetical protein
MAKAKNKTYVGDGLGPSVGTGLDSLRNGPGLGADILPLSLGFPTTILPIAAAASPLIAQLRIAWFKVDALWGGTYAMRLLSKTYLPQEPFELDSEYAARLSRTTLVNYYKNTIQDSAARVFAKDIELRAAASSLVDIASTATPPQVEFQNFAVDVDAQGTNLTQFMKHVFEQSINHGVGFILVDYPRVPVGSFNSLEAQVQSGTRPYWVHVKASNVLDCRSAMIGGKQRMTLFKYLEVINELSSDGFTPTVIEQIRIFKHDPDVVNPDGSVTTSQPMYAVYRRNLNGTSFTGEPSLAGGNSTSQSTTNWELQSCGYLTNADGEPLSGIPVAQIYTNRTGFGVGTPALDDLADLNITHYQMYSDYININHITNVPFLFAKGLKEALDDNGKKIPIILSPGRAMTTDVDYADIKWIEHTGQSIATTANALEDLAKQMKECGLKLTQEVAPQGRTATEVAVNVAESNSRLKSMALGMQDAVNLALYYTSEFFGIPDLTRAKINTEFADLIANGNDAQWISDAFTKGAIGAETLISEYKRRNILDPSCVIEPPANNEAVTQSVSLEAAPTMPNDDTGTTPDNNDLN